MLQAAMGESKPFHTERIAFWNTRELDARERKTISNIETFGCHIIQVTADCAGPGWSYTVGAYDTTGKPEIIVIGLKNDQAAMHLLNEAVRRQRAGVDLTAAPQADLLEGVKCLFRPVDPKWLKPLVGWASWYLDSWDFPVLQAIYPDLQNRFQAVDGKPDEDGFKAYFRQPLLQPGAPMTRLEEDLLATDDPTSSLSDWKFPDEPHTRIFLSQAVHTGREPVTYVSHDHGESGWQFHGDSMSEDLPPAISCFHHPIDNDPTLKELHNLPTGWYAERAAVGEPWSRYELLPDEEE